MPTTDREVEGDTQTDRERSRSPLSPLFSGCGRGQCHGSHGRGRGHGRRRGHGRGRVHGNGCQEEADTDTWTTITLGF